MPYRSTREGIHHFAGCGGDAETENDFEAVNDLASCGCKRTGVRLMVRVANAGSGRLISDEL